MVKQAKVKKGADSIGSKLQLVMKSGECALLYIFRYCSGYGAE